MAFWETLNPYFLLVSLRNFLYDRELLRVERLPLKVISVGNLSCGGTGKTTLTRFLAENLSKKYKLGILLRGYKRSSRGYKEVLSQGELKASLDEAGDEAYLLSLVFRGNLRVSVGVCEDRVYGGRVMAQKLGLELLLLDDGFQHRKIYRDLDLVLLKKQDLFDKLLPWGRLREPLSSLKRAHVLVLTYQEVYPFEFTLEDKAVFKMYRTRWRLLNWELKEEPLRKELSFICFSGLGFNSQFIEVVKKLGLKVKEFYALPDHYNYKNFKLKEEENYLTTLKDFVKLTPRKNLYVLDFEVEVPGLLEYLNQALKDY